MLLFDGVVVAVVGVVVVVHTFRTCTIVGHNHVTYILSINEF